MRRSPLDWVPRDAWLAPGYAEWPAPAALRDVVACLWASVPADVGVLPGAAVTAHAGAGPGDGAREGLVLPDGCSDIIWEEGVGAHVAGPDTGPVALQPGPGTVTVGVRFRPAAGGAVLGLPLSEIRDQRVGLADLLSAAADRNSAAADRNSAAASGLPAELAPAEAAARVLDIAGLLVTSGTPDRAAAHAAAMLSDPAARAGEVAAEIGLSERQFRRRFEAAVGYGPKTLQRVLRFRRFVRQLDASAGTAGLADAAAQAGYADQAHLTRECNALSGMTPAALAVVRGGRA